MQKYDFPYNNKKAVLALGAESAGNFSLWHNNQLYFSENFGDLAMENNFSKFQSALKKFLKNNSCKPDIILSDLHPLFQSTKLAQQLAKKYSAQYQPVQHHLAHIFSAIGDQVIEHRAWSMEQRLINNTQNTNPACLCEDVIIRSNPACCQILDHHKSSNTKILAMTKSGLPHTIFGVTCDGTGLGTDEKIWGGEVFKISNIKYQIKFPAYRTGRPDRQKNSKIQIQRIGHLENQILLGGEMAIQEPARLLIAILAKIPNTKTQKPNKHQTAKTKIQILRDNEKKSFVYSFIEKYYTPNEFEVLWAQLEQNFNCLETSSTARVLDAVSILLGFSKNERLNKHQPVKLLEENSTKPYTNISPKIQILNPNKAQNQNGKKTTVEYVLETTPLFEHLLENLNKDKKRLAATAQKYIADGMAEIIRISNQSSVISNQKMKVTNYRLPVTTLFAAGGMMDNKIISAVLTKQGFYLNQKIPRGDAGISFGQIMFYLLTK